MIKIYLLFLLSFNLFATEGNEFIVKLKNNKTFSKPLIGLLSVKNLNLSFGNFYKIKSNSSKSLDDVKKDPNVLYIEPNFKYEEYEDKSDFFSQQWSLKNTGDNFVRTVFHSGVAGKDIRALDGWTITKGNENVVVAVMDSGVDFKHPDLNNQMWTNEAEANGIEGVDDDNNGYIDDIHGFNFPDERRDNTPMDYSGHGSHIAGVIASKDDGQGIIGVAPNVKIMALKIKGDITFGYTLENILKALDYAIQNKATLVTSSIGGNDYSKAYEEALNALANANMLFVQAAGNHGRDLSHFKVYPPSYNLPNMVNVGNHSGNGKRWMSSNIGKDHIALFAPGMNILSLAPGENYSDHTRKGPNYKFMSGTSMAAPFVAGALALLYSIEPDLSYKKAKQRLIDTAYKESSMKNQCISGGRLDLFNLLNNHGTAFKSN